MLHLSMEFNRYIIKTDGSESRGQEEAGCTRQTSELFTGSTAVKFVNALNKLPLQLSLSYQRLSMSNHIELATQEWRKSAPPILSTSHFDSGLMAPVRAPTLEKPPPWHLFTCLLNKLYLHCISNQRSEAGLYPWHEFSYKGPPSINNIFTCAPGFLTLLLSGKSVCVCVCVRGCVCVCPPPRL